MHALRAFYLCGIVCGVAAGWSPTSVGVKYSGGTRCVRFILLRAFYFIACVFFYGVILCVLNVLCCIGRYLFSVGPLGVWKINTPSSLRRFISGLAGNWNIASGVMAGNSANLSLSSTVMSYL